MDLKNNNFKDLLGKYLHGSCTRDELDKLFDWAKENPEELQGNLKSYWDSIQPSQNKRTELFEQIMTQASEMEKATEKEEDRVVPLSGNSGTKWRWLSAAAAILVILSGTMLWYYLRPGKVNLNNSISRIENKNQDRMPGGDKATLTLADGSVVVLDSLSNGTVTRQGNVTVIKLAGGKLAYDKNNTPAELVYNTVTTPRGGQYQLVLADGSKVWLNAASSLKFPVAFLGDERNVELKGEGYFEVAHDSKKPFYVSSGDMKVKVLGTHFNIKAYLDEEDIKTTLIEGSVLVTAKGRTALLAPGQQARVETNSIKVSDKVNIEAVLAWKNGVFYFDKDNTQEVMRQLSRWYDVDVVYNGVIPERNFSGEMKRDLSLSQVMKILEYNNIKYSIIGKQMIISQ